MMTAKTAEAKIYEIQDVNGKVQDIAYKIGCTFNTPLPDSIVRVLERNEALLKRLRNIIKYSL